MYENRFQKGTDYKATFSAATVELIGQDMPITWRIHAVKTLTEAYTEQTGERPNSFELHALANYILKDDLSDSHPDKVTPGEFPILSRGQIKLREMRERAGGDIAYISPDRKYKLNGTRKRAQLAEKT